MPKAIITSTKNKGEKMKIGQMASVRSYNPSTHKFETAFLIKDFKSTINKAVYSRTAANRIHIDGNDIAAALVYLIGFGSENQYLYDYWFNYHIDDGNVYEIEDLLRQDKIMCIFINENNDVEEQIVIPNNLKEDLSDYISFVQDLDWTNSEFDELKNIILRYYKSPQGIWDYVTSKMST